LPQKLLEDAIERVYEGGEGRGHSK
jgi:hypothetical protein